MYHNLSSTDRFSSYSSTAVGISPNASESGRVGGVSMKPLPHSHSRNHSTQFLLAHGKGKGPLTPEMAAEAHAHAHGGSSRHGSEYESTEHQMKGKMFLGGLIKPPVVRQFMHNGYLYKEEEDRGISHFELFADLIFVAIVHIFGEAAAEEATLLNAIKFLLMFWPPWSIWADMRSYLNVSGTDDAIQRAYILVSSILLIGYTAQGASIKLHLPEEEGGSSSGPHEASSTLSAAIAEATSSLTETSESTGIHRRDTELGHPTITEGGYAALRAATAYFLVAKAIRISLLIFYAYSLPRFRTAHIVQAVFTLIPCLVFIRMFWVDSVIGAMGIFTLGVFLEVLGKYVAGILVHSGSTKKKRHQFFIPALEIGHVIEKTAAFFVLVTGEILIAVSYIAEEESEIGPRGEFWRSALGVVIAFLLCWIYFDADSCKVFVHAIRRHWFSSITWTQLHLPLCAGLVIAAAAVHKMILKQYIDQGLRWYFAGGMAAIMICLV
ncbi:hypothetical protein FRC15_004674 [Serendipita sp. 397]|nr:hypothetical protein FRC15_004674 [Serendipita sp. 397]